MCKCFVSVTKNRPWGLQLRQSGPEDHLLLVMGLGWSRFSSKFEQDCQQQHGKQGHPDHSSALWTSVIDAHETDLRHDTSSTYCAPFANPYPREDSHVSSKPAVFTDADWLAQFRALRSVSSSRIKRMGATVQRAIWPKQGSASDFDNTRVDNGGVIIYKDVLSDLYIVPIVYANWRFTPCVFVELRRIFIFSGSCRWKRRGVVNDPATD